MRHKGESYIYVADAWYQEYLFNFFDVSLFLSSYIYRTGEPQNPHRNIGFGSEVEKPTVELDMLPTKIIYICIT